MASIPIKHVQLADESILNYTLRHGLGWGFIWVLPRSWQSHLNVTAR